MRGRLTHDVVSELVLSDVVKQGGQHGEQGDGGVVDVLGHALHLLHRGSRRSEIMAQNWQNGHLASWARGN